ncbi:MAG: aminotransferase class IV [Actinomycetota bacterium]
MMISPETRAWANGRLIAPHESALSVLDHGFTVGDGVFETLKIVQGVPFALSRHLRRLTSSALALGLPAPDLDVILAGIEQVLHAGAALEFGRLRVTVTSGPGPLGSERDQGHRSVVVLAAPASRPPESIAVVTVPWARNERSAVAGVKTTSYADNVVALAYARERGAGEAIFANTRGELCEGTGSNVVVMIDGTMVTPPLSSGCLAGITRELLVQWAREENWDIEERDIPMAEFTKADEMLITSSTRDVQPVHQVDDRHLSLGPQGVRAAQLFAARAADNDDP